METMTQLHGQSHSTPPTRMSDDSFARLVADDVKNKVSPSRREFLQKPENWDRWKRALLALVANLEEQIADIEADSRSDSERYRSMGKAAEKLAQAAERDYETKRSRIRKFLFHVNKRLDHVMAMIEGEDVAVHDEWDTADIYRRAIRQHKKLMIEANLDPTPIDSALWLTLNKEWTFESVDINSID
jgi:hypothetical protein